MRAQIENGIRDAIQAGYLTRDFIDRVSEDELVADIAEKVLARLSQVPAGTPSPRVEVLPASEPVVVLDAASVVATLAEAASVTSSLDSEAMTTRIVTALPGSHESRHLLWRLQSMFGVHMISRGTGRSDDGSGTFSLAGRSSDISGLMSAYAVLVEAGRDMAERLPAPEAASLWRTIGTMIRSTERGTALIAAAADRAADARVLAYDVFGQANAVVPPPVAPEGTPIAEASRRILASAAVAHA